VQREEIDARLDELRTENPGREGFVAAVRAYSETLDADARKLLGRALLEREPETSGYDILNRRVEEGGWLQRTMRKTERPER
jgi:hypothetical protein